MGDDDKEAKEGAGKWFLKKLLVSPATWAGVIAGFAVGIPFAAETPLGGAIGFGSIVGLAVAAFTFLIYNGVRASHHQSKLKAAEESRRISKGREDAALDELRASKLNGDADLLGKILSDRDAIEKICEGKEKEADAVHTLQLISTIVEKSCFQSEEIHDLARRMADPILETPEGAEEKLEELRADLKRTYQAIADARSRLRRGERLSEVDFLADEKSIANLSLSSLAAQLEEETSVSRRIEDRVRIDDYVSGIVEDEAPDSSAEQTSELE